MQLDDIGPDDGSPLRHPSSARLGFPTRNDEAVKASLAAVRAARESARLRSRRQGWTTRISALAILGVGAAMWPVLRGHHQKGAAASPTTTVVAKGDLATTGRPENAAPAAAAPVPAPHDRDRTADAQAIIAVDTVACDQSFAAHQWKVAAEQCETAFTSAPFRADLALKIAKAQHARAHFRESVTWAETTLKLEARNAEAFAIIARSERRAGHTAEMAAAYRRYLTLAPHGWHAHEARTALRASSTPQEGSPGATPNESGVISTVSQAE